MADEKEEVQEETAAEPSKKGSSSKLLVIIIAAAIVLGAGGFVGFKLLASNGEEKETEKVEEVKRSTMVEIDPFVLNLSDHGRYLKLTIQFEISDADYAKLIENKTPHLRDTIITLVSSKSLSSISSAEGKFQLKDELLFRANQIMGMEKDILKNLYFTEFVMQ